MKISFLSGFEKELSHTRDKVLARIILDCINMFEKANHISEIPNIKQLKGHPFGIPVSQREIQDWILF